MLKKKKRKKYIFFSQIAIKKKKKKKNSPEHTTRSFPSGLSFRKLYLLEEQFLFCDSLRPIRILELYIK
jgi:hypothetical protein